MIILEKCNLFRTSMKKMQAGVVQIEGKALVWGAYEDGEATVKPSVGEAGERFAGFMVGEPAGSVSQPNQPFMGEFVVNETTHKFTLPYAPISGQIRIYKGGLEITAGAAATNTYQISGKEVTVNTAHDGATLSVRMNYAPSYGEYIARFGNGYPGGSASNQLAVTGLHEAGEIWTDQYDMAADWTSPTVIKLGADGLLTTVGSGVIVPVTIIKLPTLGDAFLAVRF